MNLKVLKARYLRKTIGYPKGVLTHFGDCSIYGSCVCDCGLIRDLRPMYGREREVAYRLLPKGFEDDSMHDVVITKLNLTGWGEKQWEEAKEYERTHPFNKKDFEKFLKEMGLKPCPVKPRRKKKK